MGPAADWGDRRKLKRDLLGCPTDAEPDARAESASADRHSTTKPAVFSRVAFAQQRANLVVVEVLNEFFVGVLCGFWEDWRSEPVRPISHFADLRSKWRRYARDHVKEVLEVHYPKTCSRNFFATNGGTTSARGPTRATQLLGPPPPPKKTAVKTTDPRPLEFSQL